MTVTHHTFEMDSIWKFLQAWDSSTLITEEMNKMTPTKEEDLARLLSNQRSRNTKLTNQNTDLEQSLDELRIVNSKLQDHIDALTDEIKDLDAEIAELKQY